jgi:hypothetical protein
MDIMKKPVLITMVVFLLIANFALLYKIKTSGSSDSQITISDSERNNLYLKEYFKEKVILQFKFDNNLIDKNLIFLTPDSDTVSTTGILTGNDKLIFYYPRNSCEPCIDIIITQIKNNIDKIGRDNVVVISEFANIRDLALFIRMNGLSEISVFSLLSKEFVVPEDEYHIPYLFVTDSTLKTKYFFLPDKDYPSLSVKYFELLNKKVFSGQ